MSTINDYPSVRTNLTAEELLAFKTWCLQNDTTMAAQVSDYVRRLVKRKENISIGRVGGMDKMED